MSINSQFSRIPKQGKSIFTIIGELAAQYKAIDLSKEFPEYNPDQKLIDLVYKNINAGYNQYAPSEGILSLRETISKKIQQQYQSNYTVEDEITITNGATEAIFNTITAFIREKDEVIILEPAFECYAPSVKLNGGIPVYIDMKSPKFQFNWDQVQLSITANTRMIIIPKLSDSNKVKRRFT
ncbi:MAG: aminotransferase class I/II-fold pyridoxal phosphate-dependent enzyme [Salinivirgaceae bacterium]|jgi:methionine aminotransferase|nr:aminotransferase class I/II-fold pyridoxal phosphate-dependent enzyme [Salinivirgaceae bacterium]